MKIFYTFTRLPDLAHLFTCSNYFYIPNVTILFVVLNEEADEADTIKYLDPSETKASCCLQEGAVVSLDS